MSKSTPGSSSRFTFLVPLVITLVFSSSVDTEAQWWKFWKKRDKTESTQSVEDDTPVGRDLKDVEKERKAAEKALKKARKEQLREEEKRQEALEKEMRDSQKAIEKHQKKVLDDHRKQQRKIMRNIKMKSSNPSGKRTSFLQRYKFRKSSGDGFFLSQ